MSSWIRIRFWFILFSILTAGVLAVGLVQPVSALSLNATERPQGFQPAALADTPSPLPTYTPAVTDTPAPSPTPTATPTPIVVNGMYTIPLGKRPVVIDGSCSYNEYRDAAAVNFPDGNNATSTVYLKHDNRYLYICMAGAVGSYSLRFASVYLDPDFGRELFPHSDDLSLRIGFPSPAYSLVGGDAPGAYYSIDLSGWSAASSVTFSDQAEFRVPISMTGCNNSFGLAVYHHWFAAPANDYGWPQSQYWDQPQTWAGVKLGGTLTGSCQYLPVVQ